MPPEGEPAEEIDRAEMEQHEPCFAISSRRVAIYHVGSKSTHIELDYERTMDTSQLSCLQIVEDAFLLLSRYVEGSNNVTYRRVACAPKCEDPGFFDNAAFEVVTIV